MEFVIVNLARLVHGAHATTMLVSDHVQARLGSYGPAAAEAWVELVYPSRSPPRSDSRFDTETHRLAASCPRVRFSRPKRKIDVCVICRGVSGRRISGDGHLTRAETVALTGTVSEALELVRPRVRPADQFDADAFTADAQAALRRYLGK